MLTKSSGDCSIQMLFTVRLKFVLTRYRLRKRMVMCGRGKLISQSHQVTACEVRFGLSL